MFMSIAAFQKLVTESIWIFIELWLKKKGPMLPQYKLGEGSLIFCCTGLNTPNFW